MPKLMDMSLEQLYAKDKITASAEQAILQKENFSKIVPIYCEKVCKLKCKSYENISLDHSEVDILIIQNHAALNDKWKSGHDIERLHLGIISELAKKNFKGLKYRVTNLTKCGIKEQDVVKGKPPTASVLMKCRPYLLEEIKRAKPKVIISMSTEVTKTLGLTGKSNYTNRGEIHNNIVLTLHVKQTCMVRQGASGGLWGVDFIDVIDRDFDKAGRLARGELVIPDLNKSIEKLKEQIVICRTLKDVKRECDAILSLPEEKVVSFDTETNTLEMWEETAKLISIQFGYRDESGRIRAVVIPLWHRDNIAYDAKDAWKILEPILTGKTKLVAHHGKFDVKFIYATTGVRVQNLVFDTMLIMHGICSGIQGSYSLKKAMWDWLPELGISGYEDLLPNLGDKIEEDFIEGEGE